MNLKLPLQLFLFLGMYIMLTSAAFIEKANITKGYENNITVNAPEKSVMMKAHRLNFFQRLMVKLILKKNKLLETIHADKLAHTSLTFGIVACGVFLIGLLVPYIILLTIPAGVAAMITGGSAERHNTTFVGKARTGKGLGLGALIAFAVILLVAALLVASLGIQ